MRFDLSASERGGRRAPKTLALRALAIAMTTALIVLFFPSAAFALPGTPSAPAQPSVTAGNASLTVAFVAPADGGSPITGYTARCASGNGGATGSNTGASSAITVSSLTNAATYVCTVHATNINGNSAESATSAALIAGAPSAPAQPTVTHGDGVISVAFVAPANNGSAIQFFTADCSSGGGAEGVTANPTSPIQVTGLDNGQTYTCTVSATNGNGTGAASVASVPAVPAGVPEAPSKPIVTRGNAQISVAFVSQGDNGSSITSFTAACTSSNGGLSGSHSGSSSPLVATGLTNGKIYTCRVLATNGEGDSAQSLASSATVPATVPSTPAAPTLVHGAAKITVTFAGSADNGGSIVTGYTASCSSSGGAAGSNTGVVSPIVVSSLTNGSTYTCTIHSTNAVGNSVESAASASTIPANVPDAPAAPSVVRGNGQISVAFIAPANNGSAITGFTASCTSLGGGTPGNASAGTSPIDVGGLTNGKTYTCTVFATNAEGDGGASAESASAVPAGLPSAPAQPVLTHGNALISVAFSVPVSDGGSAITGYTASCGSLNGGVTRSNTGATSPIVVSTLTNGKTYTCTVFATNVTGNGATSVESASTVPATVPGTPAPPTVTHGDASISVVFSTPGSDGGSAITSYTASCTSLGGDPGSNSGPSSPILVSGLTNGSTYTCVVHANNAEGAGSDSNASASTVPATVPNAPAQPTISASGTTITVTFVAPGDGGSVITGYSVSCLSLNGGASGSNTGATSPIDVTSLTLGKSYTCTVRATNAEGNSGDSAASAAATVPAVVPTKPATPTVTRGAGAILVTFVAPFDGGSPITGYTASCLSSGHASGSQSNASSPITVSGLDNGQTYACTVHATNAVGNSVESSASASVVPAAVPDAPAAPTLVHGNAQISVVFVAPANNGNVITGYTASCSSGDGGTSGSNTGSSSPILVLALTNGKTYTCTVFASNAIGNGLPSDASASTVPATVPDAPAAPTATSGNLQITVAFVAPANGGSPITGYTATCHSDDGGTDGNNTGATSPIVVLLLTNGKTYTCRVHATNAEGDSLESGASALTVPATTPAAPAKPTTIAAATHISVSFVAPANGGSVITGYTATCLSGGGGAPGSNTGASSPIAVSALTKGATYLCTVHATNVAGDSAESPVSNATVVPATVPDAPAKPTTTFGNGQITVGFVAPNDGGSAITGYSANCTSTGGGVPGSHSAGASPIVVTGLDNGQTYTCTVLATNALGDSDTSPASNATVPATVPGTPAAPTLTRGSASLSVAFVAPGSTGGSAITSYTVNCLSGDGGTTGSNSGASSPIVVSLLTNGKTYTCTVLATNVAGSGAASSASASAVPAAVPGAPAAPTLTRGNAQITVAFVPPVSDGGSAITSYTASCLSSDGGTAGSTSGGSSPIVVSLLTNGKTYTCTVLATNVVGAGAPSAASAATVPATAPSAPAAPTLTNGDSSISVAIVAPATGGSPITAYTATCASSNGGTAGNNTAAASPVLVSALTNGKTYTCTVHATNIVGSSAESGVSAATMPNVVPNVPAKPTIVGAPGHITVTFVVPGDTGTPITGYTSTCTSSNVGALGHNSGATSPMMVSGLTNGKRYTCTVHSTNTEGSSAESLASISTLVGSVPANTVGPTITGSPLAQRTLAAHNGTWTGAPAPSFHYQWQRCNRFGSACVNLTGQTASTHRLTKLDVDMRVRVIVAATNAMATGHRTTAVTAVVGPVPGAITGPYYYDGGSVRRAGVNAVGAATHGNIVWSVTADGNVTGPHFGPHGGTLVGIPLSMPIVGMQVTPSGHGYWLFAGDGGVFTFGDAHFLGSTGGMHLNSPIVTMEPTPDGLGYWLFAADGGVFTFGDAHFHGSIAGSSLAHPAVALLSTQTGNGYWIVTSNGRAFAFGDAPAIGAVTGLGRTDIVGLISTGSGFRYVTRTLQLLAP